MSGGHDSDREKKLRAGDQDRSIVSSCELDAISSPQKLFWAMCEMNLTSFIETGRIDVSPTKGNQMCDNCQNPENHDELRERISEMDERSIALSLVMSGCALLSIHAEGELMTPQMVQFAELLKMFADKLGEPQVSTIADFTNIQVGDAWLKVKADFDEWVANGGDLGEGA